MSPGSKRAGYDREQFVPFVRRLLEERNETYREAAIKAGLDRSAVWRFLNQGTRPHRDACILLAQHFEVNPNEMLAAAGYEPIALFDLSLADPGEFPPEVKALARALTEIPDAERRRLLCTLLATLVELIVGKDE
jgi:transcriptional regulator with XRE-family HTH domain